MIGMLLLYQDNQHLPLTKLIEEFSRNVRDAGGVLKITPFEGE
jgi:hypothetical protein